jgi:hypothetical protein
MMQMSVFGKTKKLLPLVIVSFLLAAAGVFFFRSPVLVVTDASFGRIYGGRRFTLGGLRNSLRLFRRVVPVVIAETAGPDLAALAVEGVSAAPRAVIFPGRSIEGARVYGERPPQTPLVVMGGRSRRPGGEGAFAFVRADTSADCYRAGLYAAAFAGKEGGNVIFFHDGILEDPDKAAFREGLRARGFLKDPIFAAATADYTSYSAISCAVVAGPAAKFLDRNLDIPVVLFSWADPEITPRPVKVVFDDSPWTLAADALGALASGEEGLPLPSRGKVLFDRIAAKEELRKIKALAEEKREKK